MKITISVPMRIAGWVRKLLSLNAGKEFFVVGGHRYPVAEFIKYSQEKQIDILTRAGATPKDIQKFLVFIKEWEAQ
jgi:hypothetical protein